VQEHYEAFRQHGAEVVAVSFSRPERVNAYLQRYPLPFPAVADPQREAYRQFGLGRATWGEILRPRVLARYFGLIFRGWLPKRPDAGEDLHQLGGDFVLDRQRRLVYAYRSTDPADRPTPAQLLQAVQAARETVAERDHRISET